MASSPRKGVCRQWGGACPKRSLELATAPELEQKPPNVMAEPFPSRQAAPAEAVPGLTLPRGKEVRRFAANSDPNPQRLRDPHSSPPPHSLLGTILCSRYYDST